MLAIALLGLLVVTASGSFYHGRNVRGISQAITILSEYQLIKWETKVSSSEQLYYNNGIDIVKEGVIHPNIEGVYFISTTIFGNFDIGTNNTLTISVFVDDEIVLTTEKFFKTQTEQFPLSGFIYVKEASEVKIMIKNINSIVNKHQVITPSSYFTLHYYGDLGYNQGFLSHLLNDASVNKENYLWSTVGDTGFFNIKKGSCSMKNGCNIMIKNAVDVIFGALGYYICGFGLSFGKGEYANGFTGFGDFFPDTSDNGWLFARYFFQLSFATTATTIVSGAMAERTNLKAYMLFSFLNLFSYVFPAHWIWDDIGFLKVMGVVDIAGCGPVHVVGGVSALLATLLLQPRLGIFDETNPKSYHMASPTNMVLGTFMLWWGWLGFNCGSTFGVSGGKWMLASRAAVNTVNGSVGGGMFSIVYSYYLTKQYKGKLDVAVFTSGILAGLVSVTGICAICRPWEALIIGAIGGIICTYGSNLVKFLHIDDPVNCIPVHLLCGSWGLLSIGFFGEEENVENLSRYNGIFKGGDPIFLAKQLLAVVCIGSWAGVTTIIELFIADRLIGLRMSEADELLGADIIEHGIHFENRSQENEIKKEKERKRSNAMRKKISDTGTNCGADVMPSSYYSEGMINFGFVSFNESSSSSVDGKLKRIKEEADGEEIERGDMKSDFTFEQVVEKEIKESKIEKHKAIRKTSRFEILHLRRSNTVT